jgi:hypothetical protein
MGSCVGWSVGYTFFSSYLRRHLSAPNWNGENTTSPSFVYHFAKVEGDCMKAGAPIHVGLECIRDNGSCLAKYWTYDPSKCDYLPSAI